MEETPAAGPREPGPGAYSPLPAPTRSTPTPCTSVPWPWSTRPRPAASTRAWPPAGCGPRSRPGRTAAGPWCPYSCASPSSACLTRPPRRSSWWAPAPGWLPSSASSRSGPGCGSRVSVRAGRVPWGRARSPTPAPRPHLTPARHPGPRRQGGRGDAAVLRLPARRRGLPVPRGAGRVPEGRLPHPAQRGLLPGAATQGEASGRPHASVPGPCRDRRPHRAPSPQVYVQHLLRRDKEHLWRLIHEAGAHIYVCG